MKEAKKDEIRRTVRERYADVADRGRACCAPAITGTFPQAQTSTCCGDNRGSADSAADHSRPFEYSKGDLDTAPEGANMGLGCGNPAALAAISPGETVLDLGCGGGFDCFLAARQVGEEGLVIGVDMTPEMVAKARENARKGGFGNVDFRLGKLEHLPVGDASVDVIISNCVLNLSPDKPRVLSEAFRVLKPGGRLAVSDMVARSPLPEGIQEDADLYCGCLAGAAFVDDLKRLLEESGFDETSIRFKTDGVNPPEGEVTKENIGKVVVPAAIEARKPI